MNQTAPASCFAATCALANARLWKQKGRDLLMASQSCEEWSQLVNATRLQRMGLANFGQ